MSYYRRILQVRVFIKRLGSTRSLSRMLVHKVYLTDHQHQLCEKPNITTPATARGKLWICKILLTPCRIFYNSGKRWKLLWSFLLWMEPSFYAGCLIILEWCVWCSPTVRAHSPIVFSLSPQRWPCWTVVATHLFTLWHTGSSDTRFRECFHVFVPITQEIRRRLCFDWTADS